LASSFIFLLLLRNSQRPHRMSIGAVSYHTRVPDKRPHPSGVRRGYRRPETSGR
jgi:hypothetical protein